MPFKTVFHLMVWNSQIISYDFHLSSSWSVAAAAAAINQSIKPKTCSDCLIILKHLVRL